MYQKTVAALGRGEDPRERQRLTRMLGARPDAVAG